jgi:molybdenum cofactor cytidylyltransferase
LVTPTALIKVMTHPLGGMKNIPAQARHVAMLNQADTPELQSVAQTISTQLLDHFHSVLITSLKDEKIHAANEKCAGIILAAGESKRYGALKQLLDWKGKPFVRQVAETALRAGLEPVFVVTGFRGADVESALSGLSVNVIHNPNWAEGQSTSIKAGVQALPGEIGSAIFLLADQPQIPVDVIRALRDTHAQEFAPIIAPLVLEEKRANPVLFDRVTFSDLMQLQGDTGGRGIFHKHRLEFMPWHDDILLLDVDKPEDYQRLMNADNL